VFSFSTLMELPALLLSELTKEPLVTMKFFSWISVAKEKTASLASLVFQTTTSSMLVQAVPPV